MQIHGGPHLDRPGTRSTGLAIAHNADGTWAVRADSLEARDLRFEHDGLTLHVARARVERLSATLEPPRGLQPPRLLQAEAARVQLFGVEAHAAQVPRAGAPPPGEWRLDALAGLQGSLHAFVTNAVWVVDAEVRLAIEQGRIDFNRATVAHVGPDSSIGISRGGIYVDSPQLGRQYLYLFTARDIPGARFEARQGRRVADRGQLDLRAFAAGLAGRPGFALPGQMAGRHVEATLDRTRVTGELQFGDGALGLARGELVLTGRAAGRNKLIVSAAVLSHKLVLRMPELAASEARFGFASWAGASGAVSADLSVRVSGLGNDGARPELTVALGHLSVEHLRLNASPEPTAQ